MLALLLLLADDARMLMEAARAKLAVERPCVADPNSTDITVCGLRRADRFRVPFVSRDPDDPRNTPVMAERQALLHRTSPVQEHSTFLVGGGMAGVSATLRGDGSVSPRPLAP